MKKKLFIIPLLFLLCGCTCEYNLKIDANSYQEKLTINPSNSEEKNYILNDEWIIDINFDEYNETEEVIEKHTNNKYYDANIINNHLVLSYLHNINTIKRSTIALKCFDKVSMYQMGNNFYISTSNKFKCFSEYEKLDNVKVIIEVNGNVTYNNADQISNNKYIWNYNKNNINKGINITVNTDNQTNSNSSTTNNSSSEHNSMTKNYGYYIFIISLILLLGIGYLIYRKMKKTSDNNNEI